jgi:RHS repeat-associated protein
MDDKQRVALVETRTHGDDGSPARLSRYQLGNHLGSASLELDEAGRIISYEEYLPYGSTSYQAVDASIHAAAKRYRYTSMERDDETGLAYHGARYYAPWLGRWTACDPDERFHPYSYVQNNPVVHVDTTGQAPLIFSMLGDSSPGPHPTVDILANPVLAGGLQLMAGTLEYFSGATFLAAPEPTLLSKAAGGLLIAHGTDTLATGVMTPETQTLQQTYTAQAGEAFAANAGAPPPVVRLAGVVADIAPGSVAVELAGISKLATASAASRLGRIPSPTPGAFEWAPESASATSEMIVPIPRAAHLTEDVDQLYRDAVFIAGQRGARVVPLDRIANYPEAAKVVFFGHANQFTLGGLTFEDLNSALVNAGLKPNTIELAGCSTGAPFTWLEGVAGRVAGAKQPLAPGVASLSGTEITAYTQPISASRRLPLSTGSFGAWHALEGGGLLYDDATQVVFRPPPSGQ